jgi:predicted RND superfamily exporter protein
MKDLLVYIFSDYKIFLAVCFILILLSNIRLFEINHYYINNQEKKEMKEVFNIWDLIVKHFKSKKK